MGKISKMNKNNLTSEKFDTILAKIKQNVKFIYLHIVNVFNCVRNSMYTISGYDGIN